jgi:hypothetical protein
MAQHIKNGLGHHASVAATEKGVLAEELAQRKVGRAVDPQGIGHGLLQHFQPDPTQRAAGVGLA